MENISNVINGWLSSGGSGSLMHALMGLVILIVGLILVKFIVGIIRRVLDRISILKFNSSDGSVLDLVSPIVSLLKAILTIFVLMAVLQHFGFTNVLQPLEAMVGKFLNAIPNVIGAGVIMYAGWMIAKVVSQLVSLVMGKVDQTIEEKTGNKDIKISAFASALIFGAILLPIIVVALGVLNIPAISDPASAMIQKLMDAVPNIIAAVIILTVTFYVAKFVNYMLSGLLEGLQLNALPKKIGLNGVFTKTFTPIKLVNGAITFFAMLGAASAAVEILGIDVISSVFSTMMEFGGGILLGGAILVIGNYLSIIAANAVSKSGQEAMSNVVRFAILGLVLAMGLKAMGLADNIVNMAFGLTLGSVAVAAAIAFGFGGQEAAKKISNDLAKKLSK